MTVPRRGHEARLSFTVGDGDTALAVGSGDVAVLATPRLIAWFEAATVAALSGHLRASDTSVGTRIDVQHRAPSPVGAQVEVSAEVAAVDGRTVEFEVVAWHADGIRVGRGRIERAIVDRERFIGRAGGR